MEQSVISLICWEGHEIGAEQTWIFNFDIDNSMGQGRDVEYDEDQLTDQSMIYI